MAGVIKNSTFQFEVIAKSNIQIVTNFVHYNLNTKKKVRMEQGDGTGRSQ